MSNLSTSEPVPVPPVDQNATTEPVVVKKGLPWGKILAMVAVFMLLLLVFFALRRVQLGTVRMDEPVPNFTLMSYDGQEIPLNSLIGKVVVINFWASWCKPCEQEAADLESAWRHYQSDGDVVFLGIAWTDTDKNAQQYLEKFDITYPNGPDLGTRISQKFRITGVPETYIVDKAGNLAYFKFSPFISEQEIINVIDPLVEE
jgi:cytochrome c biogenesis protein CcmG/thiol:disulfide interchange protein DsbE